MVKIARKNWAPNTKDKDADFSKDLINKIYDEEIKASKFNPRKIVLLEFRFAYK